MNHIERFQALMNFQAVDRLPRIEWASWWDQTIQRWRGEGLPELDRWELYEYFGLDPYLQYWLRPMKDTFPATPHGQGAVAGMDDYLAIRPHLWPDVAGALGTLAAWGRRQQAGEAVVWITLEGYFWFPRALLGIEPHMYAFYDQPELMHRINQDLTDYYIRLLRRMSPLCRPAFMTFAEDMSYNHGPMLSGGQFNEFLAPYYRQIVPVLKELGTRVLVDTDGDVTAMIPWMQAVGIEGVLPLERQAGVDAAAIRRAHGQWLMIGQYDKMVMPRGPAAMRAEFERLLPVMRGGGFIPSVDHQTPPGVSLDQYRAYLELLAHYTELAAK
jgi:hypothetical protein